MTAVPERICQAGEREYASEMHGMETSSVCHNTGMPAYLSLHALTSTRADLLATGHCYVIDRKGRCPMMEVLKSPSRTVTMVVFNKIQPLAPEEVKESTNIHGNPCYLMHHLLRVYVAGDPGMAIVDSDPKLPLSRYQTLLESHELSTLMWAWCSQITDVHYPCRPSCSHS